MEGTLAKETGKKILKLVFHDNQHHSAFSG